MQGKHRSKDGKDKLSQRDRGQEESFYYVKPTGSGQKQKPRWKRHLLRIYQNTKEVKPQVRRKLPWIPE